MRRSDYYVGDRCFGPRHRSGPGAEGSVAQKSFRDSLDDCRVGGHRGGGAGGRHIPRRQRVAIAAELSCYFQPGNNPIGVTTAAITSTQYTNLTNVFVT